MVIEPVTLYRKNKLGVGTWRCWAEGATVYVAHAQVVGGAEVVHAEPVPKGLAGRTLEEQVQSRIDSRANRQRDKGYVDIEEIARTTPRTNTLGTPLPMLAKVFADLKGRWPGKGVVQRKFDGFRCLVTRNDEGAVFCYSRQGKELPALSHVCEAYEPWLPDGVIVDGEIYEHGKPLQAIASLAKRKQAGTEKLVHHAYDMIDDGGFLERYSLLEDIVARIERSVVIVPNHHVKSQEEMWALFAQFRSDGYEGAMLRIPDSKYESGSRSMGLLKVKARADDEFEVIDVVEDLNGNGVLVCRSKSTTKPSFRTSAPGSHDQKKFVLLHKDQYVGRKVTVEYPNLTNDGIPFQPVATRWRDEL